VSYKKKFWLEVDTEQTRFKYATVSWHDS